MTTKNPRINVTFEDATLKLLSSLAHMQDKSLSKIVKDLTIEALEMKEDLYLCQIAEDLDKENIENISHEEAWK